MFLQAAGTTTSPQRRFHTFFWCGTGSVLPRRRFTIRLKRLKPRSPDFWGPRNFGIQDNFQHFCKQLHLYFCFDSKHVFFTMPLTKDLIRRMSAKHWSEWRWAFSYGVVNWLLLLIMCGTKRLNPFFRLCKASEVLHKYVMWVWSPMPFSLV